MRLKALELIGFKSFVDRTVVHFEEGVTGIVGPNGSGKSNLVDAIRWVMGEQSAKHLRGQAMEDVIFNGSEKRQANGMAQVFLTFDNSDGRAPAEYSQFSEIQVGRRLYRSGESEYFINKTPCRLRDIIDLFLGTGVGTKAYSIVEQGMIGTVVSAKPQDLRLMIEEAAGISKFKARKQAALRRMEATQANLSRLADVIAEIERQMNSLNRQAKKAERYREANDELRGRELALAATRHRQQRTQLAEVQQEHQRLKEIEATASAQLAQHEAGIETQRLELAQVERALDTVQQELYAAQNAVKLHEANMQHKMREIETLTLQGQTSAGELDELRSRLTSIEERIASASAEKQAADIVLAESTQAVQSLEQTVRAKASQRDDLQRESNAARERAYAAAAGLTQYQEKLDNSERREIDLAARINRDQAELDTIEPRREIAANEINRLSREQQNYKQLKLTLAEESSSLRATLAQQRAAMEQSEARVQELRAAIQEKQSRFESLQELRKNLEGYHDGVRAVLKRSREAEQHIDQQWQGIVGTVGEVIDAEPQYEKAVSAVLGEKLQYVVVQSHAEGIAAIDYLKSASQGRSTFVPLALRVEEQHASSAANISGDGVIGPLMQYVRFADDHQRIVQYLLGDVVLVNDLQRALSLWQQTPGRASYVTLDGDVVDAYGVVTGGNAQDVSEQLLSQKRKLKELESELSELRGQLTTASGEAAAYRDHVKSIEQNLENLTRDAHSEELKLVGVERDLDRLRAEVARYEKERDRLSTEVSKLREEQQEILRTRSEAQMRIEQLTAERAAAEAALQEHAAGLQQVARELQAQEQDLVGLRVRLAQAQERAGAITREVEGLTRQQTETAAAIERRAQDIASGSETITVLKQEVEQLREQRDHAVRSAADLSEQQQTKQIRFDEMAKAVSELELGVRDVRRTHQEASQAAHELDIRITEQRSRLQYLVDGIRERYRLELADVENEYARDDHDYDIDAEHAVVEELKERLDKIGPVNVDAIKEYEELSERFDFLSRQHNDLIASLDGLARAISKINRTSKQRFRDTFEAVNAQFQQLFPNLFRGGKAYLQLSDESDLLETGVEIFASPPGKKLQSITLLSGGEKALTAMALIFSIFLIKPSPFCLLDEVDAPLDDANIDRFNELIRSMIGKSQFILITHNKRTMEMADLLYGVTMEEPGVSKMVSVRLNQEKFGLTPTEKATAEVA